MKNQSMSFSKADKDLWNKKRSHAIKMRKKESML
jgi:hypothetical protein